MEQGFLCMECWCHIFLFHKFRKTVLRVHAELIEKEKQLQVVAESHDPELPSQVVSRDNCSIVDDSVNTVTVIKNEVDTISMPDLELLDVYQDSNTKYRSAENGMLLTSSCGMDPKEEYQDNGKSKIFKRDYDEMMTYSISDDGESASSNDELEDFDDPIGFFSGASFNEENLTTELVGKSGNMSSTKNAGVSRRQGKIMLHQDNYDSGYNQSMVHGSHYYETDDSRYDIPNEITNCGESDDLIAKWLPKLECVVCHEQFSKFTLLKEHFRLNHPTAEFFVSCCKRKLNYRCQVEKHVRLHLDPKSFKCKLCLKRFSTKSYLQSHRCLQQLNFANQSLDDGSPNKNRVQVFQNMEELIAQWKPYLQCVVCNRSFSRYSVLSVHFRHIHPTEKFYVVCCRRKFSRRYKLVDHIKVHLDPSSFQCDICGKNLSNRDILQVHKASQHPTAKGDTNKDGSKK